MRELGHTRRPMKDLLLLTYDKKLQTKSNGDTKFSMSTTARIARSMRFSKMNDAISALYVFEIQFCDVIVFESFFPTIDPGSCDLMTIAGETVGISSKLF